MNKFMGFILGSFSHMWKLHVKMQRAFRMAMSSVSSVSSISSVFAVLVAAFALMLSPAANSATSIEFYHAGIDHYFMTASVDEATFLDNNKSSWGWERTGKTFNVSLTNASASSNVSPVCRFYGVFSNGTVGSHFTRWTRVSVPTSRASSTGVGAMKVMRSTLSNRPVAHVRPTPHRYTVPTTMAWVVHPITAT